MTKVQGRLRPHQVPVQEFVGDNVIEEAIEETKELKVSDVKEASAFMDLESILKKIDEGLKYAERASKLLGEVRGDIRELRAQVASCHGEDDSKIMWSCIADDGKEHFFALERDAIRNAPDQSSIKKVYGHFEGENFIKVR